MASPSPPRQIVYVNGWAVHSVEEGLEVVGGIGVEVVVVEEVVRGGSGVAHEEEAGGADAGLALAGDGELVVVGGEGVVGVAFPGEGDPFQMRPPPVRGWEGGTREGGPTLKRWRTATKRMAMLPARGPSSIAWDVS